ncbi:HPr family phosphocarrier protein [Ahrensia marina]|uniref:Phosphate ABC transporter permease n=1 Tax=Ahrensia marina TaxID=1514904 RepID=A0A0N0E899_9HYPH|nr:HPr family phosphocarrier protein [Ahrensia marina]KPB02105.1 phosphate ABC transporter permease [Ahrensia marina]
MSAPISKTLTIQNKKGLHARASARFVQTVEEFDVKVIVSKDDTNVGGTSIMGLMMLAASQGSQIEVSTAGPDAKQAMSAIEALIADKFGEND